MRIAGQSEQAHQAHRRLVREFAEFTESDSGIDVFPMQRFARLELAGQQAVRCLSKERFVQGGIALKPLLHIHLEISGQHDRAILPAACVGIRAKKCFGVSISSCWR